MQMDGHGKKSVGGRPFDEECFAANPLIWIEPEQAASGSKGDSSGFNAAPSGNALNLGRGIEQGGGGEVPLG